MKRIGLTALLGLSLTACTFIDMKPGAEAIVLASESGVTDCKKLGTSTGSVVHRAAGFDRLPEVVADELERLARNAAVDAGANTLVALTPVSEGKRTYGMYSCHTK